MKRCAVLLLFLGFMLTGCQTRREYLSVKPHEEQYVQQENADATVVSDYNSFVSALLQQCSRRETKGVFRVYGYPGEIMEDVPKAIYYVAKQSAIGAYAVDFITYDCTQIVSYYEISVDITYKKTLEEMQALIVTRGEDAIRLRISNAMQNYEPSLTLRVYDDEIFDVQPFIQSCYEENPGRVQACPAVEAKHYPQEVENEYILELNFSYPHSAQILQQYQQEVDAVVDAAVEYVQYREQEEEKLQLLYVYLSERFDYREERTDTPVYSVLCEGKADSESFARTMKVLCEAVGLECWVVEGSYNAQTWYWNIVCVDGQYYHVDLMRCVTASEAALQLNLDSAMRFYEWIQAEYPACTLRPDVGMDLDKHSGEESGENMQPAP